MELGTGLVIMYFLFMGIYLGGRQLAGGAELGGVEGTVVGFTMLFFALMALNTMSIDIENEARQGTLEQVVLCAPSFLGLLWMRAVVHLGIGSLAVILLSLAIQLSTGRLLRLAAAEVLPAALAIFLTVAGLCGFGLILGGLSLVLKRIGQLSSLIQFALFFPALADLSGLSPGLHGAIMHFPFVRGVQLLKLLFADAAGQAVAADIIRRELLWLAADSLIYIGLGSLVFLFFERLARRGGMLAHY
jgi:ABC-2 type transport system permease protein